jgi:hypothetical protein
VLPRPALRDAFVRDEEVRRRIRAHAAVRHQQGVPVDGVICEYQVLRQVITERLRAEMDPHAVAEVLEDIHALLDDAVRLTAAEYLRLLINSRRTQSEQPPAP